MTQLLPLLAALLIAAATAAPDAPRPAAGPDGSSLRGAPSAHHLVKRGRGKDDAAGHTRKGRGADDGTADDRGGKRQKGENRKKDDGKRKGAEHGPNHR